MSGTKDAGRTPEDQARPDGVSEDAGAIEGLGLQPGAEADRPEPTAQPQDPPEELEEERRG